MNQKFDILNLVIFRNVIFQNSDYKRIKQKKILTIKNNELNYELKKVLLKIIFLIILFFIIILSIGQKKNYKNITTKKRIGVINLFHLQNVGNILVKFAIFKKLKEFGLNPVIISQNYKRVNISFINRTTILKNIKDFTELNEIDYDYLIVNSDQTWGYFNKNYFYDIAFLRFAENWTIPKFIYAASIGSDRWFYTSEEDAMASRYLKNFTGISFREKGTVKLAEDHLTLTKKPIFVLDPTFIIDTNYYLNEIKNYKRDFNFNEKYIFVYQLDKNIRLEKTLNESSSKFNYKIYKLNLNENDYIESFLFGINISQAVITDSFHGTAFSIIFNKPFISFINRGRGKGRFDSLKEVFNLENRIIDIDVLNPNINLLSEPLNINRTLLNELKTFSINYLKKRLDIMNQS